MFEEVVTTAAGVDKVVRASSEAELAEAVAAVKAEVPLVHVDINVPTKEVEAVAEAPVEEVVEKKSKK
jgi:hypothetical protein